MSGRISEMKGDAGQDGLKGQRGQDHTAGQHNFHKKKISTMQLIKKKRVKKFMKKRITKRA